MMNIKGRLSWIILMLFSLGVCLLWLLGFVWAIYDNNGSTGQTVMGNSSQEETALTDEGGLLLGLGDSITRGTGDNSGQGYFGYVRQSLREQTSDQVKAVNLGIKGQTSSELVTRLEEESMQAQLQQAKWITISIGGNDLFRGSGELDKIDLEASAQTKDTYEENVSKIFANIRKQNKDATIFIYGLYNPFGKLEDAETTSSLVQEWNELMHELAAQEEKIVVVPTYDLFQLNPKGYLYSDQFHPNHAGHQAMAERLLQAMGISSRSDGGEAQ
ncbi:GDSL-type esterase/lipase family protein [Mechercharimyces sp. CAU 1602]|uniref:GDSL-type esterase/lipase family protein n=1 Tax=Mechercharimyces sp. CAU 1602 TaxID=2973933 RepID=UPI0021635C3E|nr:GDSL-type esterase/lipase family protein [Mechercharimyces sp. CAU 1602]MCS1350018.1 GDSL-type esterase/lipase family protein [Mechercharimyces sp. CAU 1602]